MSLVPRDNVTVCPRENVTFRCTTTGGALLWETSTAEGNELFNKPDKQPVTLGIFKLILIGFMNGNKAVLEVNSTATTTNVQPSVNGATLSCSVTNGSDAVKDQATLIFAG